jgi:hypothetical protein
MTRLAWSIKKDELRKAQPGVTRRQFVYNISRASYRKEWDGKYKPPGIGTRILAFIIRILPKFGPLTALKFLPPTPAVSTLFETSFNRTIDEYRRLIAEQVEGHLTLQNLDFDTGKPSQPAEYSLADDAYASLARKISDPDRPPPDPKLLKDVLAFFQDLSLNFSTKRDPEEWQKTREAVQRLRNLEERMAY